MTVATEFSFKTKKNNLKQAFHCHTNNHSFHHL